MVNFIEESKYLNLFKMEQDGYHNRRRKDNKALSDLKVVTIFEEDDLFNTKF